MSHSLAWQLAIEQTYGSKTMCSGCTLDNKTEHAAGCEKLIEAKSGILTPRSKACHAEYLKRYRASQKIQGKKHGKT